MPGLVNEQPVSLTFGVEVRVWIIMIQRFPFSFIKSQIDLCTDVVIAAQKTRGSLAARRTRTLENRFKDLDFKRQLD